MNRINITIFVLLLCVVSCIDSYNLVNIEYEESIVIQGILDSQNGNRQTINISKTLPTNGDLFQAQGVNNAQVCIINSDGVCFDLLERGRGNYETDPTIFTLEYGKSYQLRISLEDGRQYQSTEEYFYRPSVIDTAYVTYNQTVTINEENQLVNVDFLGVFIDNSPRFDPSNYYRWRLSGIYELNTFPQQGQPPIPACAASEICTCCRCWVTETFNKVTTDNSTGYTDQIIKNKNIGSINITNQRFSTPYYIKVDQVSLTEQGYSFWKLFEKTQNNTGTIFDPPPFTVTGNITNINNTEERVFGLFSTYSRAEYGFFINNGDIPRAIGSPALSVTPCTFFPNSTNVKPVFWPF